MEKYEILRRTVPNVKLVSLTSQNWYDSEDNLVPWTGSSIGIYIGPKVNDIVFNVTGGTVTSGHYKWLGLTWTGITISEVYEDNILPLYLENTVDDLGVMVGWDGYIQQVEQLCNFTYTGNTNNTILTLSNSASTDALKIIANQEFKIEWGDGNSVTMTGIITGMTHTYPITGGTYEVSINLNSTWTNQKLTKTITLPFINPNSIVNEFGTMIYDKSWWDESGLTQNYITEFNTGQTTGNTFVYVAIGGSKIDQKILYGQTSPTGIVTGTTEGLSWSGYTIDDFYYRDFADGYTMITGTSIGVPKEEVYKDCITRNEHFIGFVDEPTIYSDIFVERGKQGVMEKNLRLAEINNVGEIELYGNGYFNVRKQ